MAAPPGKAAARSNVSSIEARRILSVMSDFQDRVHHALMLPQLSDFLETHTCPVEEFQMIQQEYTRHQQAIASMLTADGELKQTRSKAELDEEVELYKGCSRDLIRVMRKHASYFAELMQRSLAGASNRLVVMMRELFDMKQVVFATPVENDQKQRRMLDEIRQRQKTSLEFLDQLSKRLGAVQADSDKRIRVKEDELEEIKQALAQARASEAALREEDVTGDDQLNPEEQLKASLAEAKQELQGTQKADSDEEQRTHRQLRKDEETLQALIVQYDQVMFDLSGKIDVAKVEVEEKEGIYNELKAEYDEIERQRAPLKQEEAKYRTAANQVNSDLQELSAATVAAQALVRKYLKTAPPIVKKKPKKAGGGKKKKGKKGK